MRWVAPSTRRPGCIRPTCESEPRARQTFALLALIAQPFPYHFFPAMYLEGPTFPSRPIFARNPLPRKRTKIIWAMTSFYAVSISRRLSMDP